LRRPDIVDDAAALLEALSEGLRERDLSVIASRSEGVDSAMDALDHVPATAIASVNTAMQTDAFSPEDLMLSEPSSEAVAHDATEDLSEVADQWAPEKPGNERANGADPADEAQRAARAALQRWTSSSSE